MQYCECGDFLHSSLCGWRIYFVCLFCEQRQSGQGCQGLQINLHLVGYTTFFRYNAMGPSGSFMSMFSMPLGTIVILKRSLYHGRTKIYIYARVVLEIECRI